MIFVFLEDLENVITSAKLHITHPGVLSNQNCEEILKVVQKLIMKILF